MTTPRLLQRRRERRRAAIQRFIDAANAAHDVERGFAEGSTVRTSRVMFGPVETSPYKGHATVFRCIRVIVGALIRAPLVAKTGTEGRSPVEWRIRAMQDVGRADAAPMTGEPLTSGPWYDLLLNPNPYMTRRQFVEAHGVYLLTTGECGWYLERKGEPCPLGQMPDRIWPTHRAMLEPILDEDVLEGWRITTGGSPIEVPPWSMVHHRYAFDPDEPLRGLGPIGAARSAMRADMKAEAWSEAFFDNAAEPGGILSTDGVLTPKQREDMRAAWEAKHMGPQRRGRTAVLEGGLTYQQVGISQRDMDFLAQRQWNDTQIARVFGVPKFFLMEGTDISYASTRQNKRALWELAVMPIVDSTEDVSEARLTSPRDASVWLEFDVTRIEALKEDLAANLEVAERMTRIGYPLNETNERLDLGMARQPWGDEGMLPMGVAPASQVAAGIDPYASEPTPDAVDEANDDEALPQEDKPPETGEDSDTEPVRRVRVYTRIEAGEDAEARAARSARWRVVERGVMRPGTGKLQRRVRGWMNGRRAEVLRFLSGLERGNTIPRAKSAINQFLGDASDRWSGMIARQTQPIFRGIVEAAANGVARELGGLAFFNMGDPAVAAFLQRKVSLITGVSDTIRDGLRDTLRAGIEAGEDVNQLQDRARLVFRAGMNRSLTIARTESAQATNGARFLVMRKEKVEQHEWLTSDDEAVRDETGSARLRPKANHRVLDGTEKPVGETFVAGITLAHPGDVRAPAHWVINCRCVAGAVRG